MQSIAGLLTAIMEHKGDRKRVVNQGHQIPQLGLGSYPDNPFCQCWRQVCQYDHGGCGG